MRNRWIVRPIKDRLTEHREIQESHWLWTGFINKDGYGTMWIEKKHYLVHRISYCEYNNIPIETLKSLVLHDPTKCNIRRCFNPEHLREGSQQENIYDKNTARTLRVRQLKPQGGWKV